MTAERDSMTLNEVSYSARAGPLQQHGKVSPAYSPMRGMTPHLVVPAIVFSR